MRILFLNWKDIKHPYSGGAEYATHQFAKHLFSLGHEVTLLTSRPSGLPVFDMIDGVTIVRRGHYWSVYFWTFVTYIFYFRFHTDLVIDQIHGIPFFTPLFVQIPILTWIHEVAGDIWKKEFGNFWGTIGSFWEKIFLRWYRKTDFLTESDSTRHELIRLGITKEKIHLIPLTIEKPKLVKAKKTQHPSFLYIGRITPMKRIELLLLATQRVQQKIHTIKLLIVGKAKEKYKQELLKLVKRLNITKYVEFLGSVSESEKYTLLSSSWLHVQPSMKEGFGLTVLEAATQKTPTIAFKVPGLRDVIRQQTNGVLIIEESPEALAQTIKELIQNKKRLYQLSQKTFDWSKTLPTWKTQTKKLEQLLKRLVKESQ